MPELGKLIVLSDLFRVTVDDLVKDRLDLPDPDRTGGTEEPRYTRLEAKMDDLTRYMRGYAYDSKRRLFGLPLVSIRLTRRGFWGRDSVARGIIAIGNVAVGGVAIGACSVGLVSIGALSPGPFGPGCAGGRCGSAGGSGRGGGGLRLLCRGHLRRRCGRRWEGDRRGCGSHGRDRRGPGGGGGTCPPVGQRSDPSGGGVVPPKLSPRSLAAADGCADDPGRAYQVTISREPKSGAYGSLPYAPLLLPGGPKGQSRSRKQE